MGENDKMTKRQNDNYVNWHFEILTHEVSKCQFLQLSFCHFVILSFSLDTIQPVPMRTWSKVYLFFLKRSIQNYLLPICYIF